MSHPLQGNLVLSNMNHNDPNDHDIVPCQRGEGAHQGTTFWQMVENGGCNTKCGPFDLTLSFWQGVLLDIGVCWKKPCFLIEIIVYTLPRQLWVKLDTSLFDKVAFRSFWFVLRKKNCNFDWWLWCILLWCYLDHFGSCWIGITLCIYLHFSFGLSWSVYLEEKCGVSWYLFDLSIQMKRSP